MKFVLLITILIPSLALARTLRVFSLNLHCALGEWEERMDLVIDEVLRENPDVIGFQEVCRNKNVDMAAYLRRGLLRGGYPILASESFDTHRSFVHYQEELLILSRHPATDRDRGTIPSPGFLKNGFVALEIGGEWFVTTHLHFALPQIRKSQYKFLDRRFREKSSLVFGDLNSHPGNRETKVFSGTGWVPAFAGPTYPAENPKRIFDGFWSSPAFGESCSVTALRKNFADVPLPPSDHLGLTLDLSCR